MSMIRDDCNDCGVCPECIERSAAHYIGEGTDLHQDASAGDRPSHVPRDNLQDDLCECGHDYYAHRSSFTEHRGNGKYDCAFLYCACKAFRFSEWRNTPAPRAPETEHE